MLVCLWGVHGPALSLLRPRIPPVTRVVPLLSKDFGGTESTYTRLEQTSAVFLRFSVKKTRNSQPMMYSQQSAFLTHFFCKDEL